jgi:hypothetical protein
MGKLIAALFPGASLIRLAVYAAIFFGAVASLSAVYFGWRHHERMIGWNSALATVKAQNEAAKGIADRVNNAVDKCFADGGSWNVSTGKCE